MSRQLALAREAVEMVMHDASATSDLAADVSVDVEGSAIRITFDGSDTTPSMMAFDGAAAVAEVGDYLQDHIAEALRRTWPVCPKHGLG